MGSLDNSTQIKIKTFLEYLVNKPVNKSNLENAIQASGGMFIIYLLNLFLVNFFLQFNSACKYCLIILKCYFKVN